MIVIVIKFFSGNTLTEMFSVIPLNFDYEMPQLATADQRIAFAWNWANLGRSSGDPRENLFMISYNFFFGVQCFSNLAF